MFRELRGQQHCRSLDRDPERVRLPRAGYCTKRITLLQASGGRLGTEFASLSIQGIPLNPPYTAAITYDSE